MGLSISKQIIEAHGGRIGAFANPHAGSVFWFEIPFKLAQVEITAPVQTALETTDQGSAKRILLAEDDEINMLVAVRQLEVLGHQVDVASNGYEALQALEQRDYALILMDCQMPGLDGLQATRLIREKGYSHSELPIIALTANVFDEDREACFESGMDDFVAKPVLLESLHAVLVKWL